MFRTGQRVTVLPYARPSVPIGFPFRGVVDMPSLLERKGGAERGAVRVCFETPHARCYAWFGKDDLAEGWGYERKEAR